MDIESLIKDYPIYPNSSKNRIREHLENKGEISVELLRRCGLDLLDIINKYQHVDKKIIKKIIHTMIEQRSINILMVKYCTNKQLPIVLNILYMYYHAHSKSLIDMLLQNTNITELIDIVPGTSTGSNNYYEWTEDTYNNQTEVTINRFGDYIGRPYNNLSLITDRSVFGSIKQILFPSNENIEYFKEKIKYMDQKTWITDLVQKLG